MQRAKRELKKSSQIIDRLAACILYICYINTIIWLVAFIMCIQNNFSLHSMTLSKQTRDSFLGHGPPVINLKFPLLKQQSFR